MDKANHSEAWKWARGNLQGGCRIPERSYSARKLLAAIPERSFPDKGTTCSCLCIEQAKNHGNEPSKGAKIDAEIQQEEEEMLKKKGAWGPK